MLKTLFKVFALLLAFLILSCALPITKKKVDLLAETHCNQYGPGHPGFTKACLRNAIDSTKGVYLNLVRITETPLGDIITEALDRPGHGNIYDFSKTTTALKDCDAKTKNC